MRVLVAGASGYLGTQVVPRLLARGHQVIAGVRNVDKLTACWRADVEVVHLDVLQPSTLTSALGDDTDAIIYLVHGMGGQDFERTDRAAAENTHAAASRAGVHRVVYVSGLIPQIAEGDLSPHLRSRLEVEKVLSREWSGSTITLRAAMILGAGSTSYEVMSRIAMRSPVTAIPSWMQHQAEPVSIADVVEAIAGALVFHGKTRHFDVGCGEVSSYPDLVAQYKRLARRTTPAVAGGPLPLALVARAASLLTGYPLVTVKPLLESLKHDMVAADNEWIGALVGPEHQPVSTERALREAAGHRSRQTGRPRVWPEARPGRSARCRLSCISHRSRALWPGLRLPSSNSIPRTP